MTTWIAGRKIIAENLETGERKDITIRIGTPFWLPDDDFASCPVEWEGLFDSFADAKGIDLLQALQQATHIEPLLERLRGKYNFYWPSGERYFDDS